MNTTTIAFLVCILYLKVTFSFCAAIGPKNFTNDGRVIGGDDIDISEAPYQVLVRTIDETHNVAEGAILTKNMVLTSAHAIYTYNATTLIVRVGSSIRYMFGQYVQAFGKNYHPKYNHSLAPYDYDIAIILLIADLNICSNLNTELIKIPPLINLDVGLPVDVTGWGSETSLFVTLQKISIQILDPAQCKSVYGDQFTDRMLCAADLNWNKHACPFDVGDPMVLQGTNLLLGVVSFGTNCSNLPYPTVFTNVANPEIQSFIINTIQQYPK